MRTPVIQRLKLKLTRYSTSLFVGSANNNYLSFCILFDLVQISLEICSNKYVQIKLTSYGNSCLREAGSCLREAGSCLIEAGSSHAGEQDGCRVLRTQATSKIRVTHSAVGTLHVTSLSLAQSWQRCCHRKSNNNTTLRICFKFHDNFTIHSKTLLVLEVRKQTFKLTIIGHTHARAIGWCEPLIAVVALVRAVDTRGVDTVRGTDTVSSSIAGVSLSNCSTVHTLQSR
jgi:hypothetical protein